MRKRIHTCRQARRTFRQRTKAPVKNVPASHRPDKPDIVFVHSDDDIVVVDLTASNDNLVSACFPEEEFNDRWLRGAVNGGISHASSLTALGRAEHYARPSWSLGCPNRLGCQIA